MSVPQPQSSRRSLRTGRLGSEEAASRRRRSGWTHFHTSPGSGWMAGERRLDPRLGGGLARGTRNAEAGAFPTGWLRRGERASRRWEGSGDRPLVPEPARRPRAARPSPTPTSGVGSFVLWVGFGAQVSVGASASVCGPARAPGGASARRGESGLRAPPTHFCHGAGRAICNAKSLRLPAL